MVIAESFLDFDPKGLSALSADDAVHLFRTMLWCEARRQSLPIQSITISTAVNVADGGIDAEISQNAITPEQDLLMSGNSFFQIKAGASAKPWQKSWLRKELLSDAKKRPNKQALGESVRHCLGRKGRYVLVCFGCDLTGLQHRQAIAHLRELIEACGYKRTNVDVWGQGTLAGLIEPFPSISLRLSGRNDLPFWTYNAWKLDSEMSRPLQLGKDQTEVVNQIRDCLRGTEVRHVRLIGEPGLGKTRLVLEAVSAEDLAPTVIYAQHPEDFERSQLFHAILRTDNTAFMTLVIDDCPEKERASIWNSLRQRSERIHLVTLDHGPETSTDKLMKVIDCPPLDNDHIKAILAGYTGSDRDMDRWAEFCEGSPRVAHAIGENLRQNPGDILKPPATVPIWDRFIHGNSKRGSQDESQREIVLRHIALFRKFGFENPVEEEAHFIAELAEKADPAITWPKFQSIIKHYRDRRIIQGKTTLFLVPRALHIWLWLEFWEHYGSGMDVSGLMSRMPQSLMRWFMEMFKYGHSSPKCLAQIERITSYGGPFDNKDFIVSGPGARFLNELAEAHPQAALRLLERTVGSWSHDELVTFGNNRQYLVWALEKIAVWQDHFRPATRVLMRLALAENATNGNNATGTFCGLFDVYASSQAPHELRLPILQSMLNSPDRATHALGLKAASRSLANDSHWRMVGPEHQGMRQVLKFWTPKTYGEIYNAYRAAWKMVASFWRNAIGEDKTQAANVMVDSAFGLVQNRWIQDDILVAIKDLVSDPHSDLRPIVQLISRFRWLKWKGLSRKCASSLRAIDEGIRGTSASSQITRIVLLGNHDDLDRSNSSDKKHIRTLHKLARSALAEPLTLTQLLPKLLSENGFLLWSFGRAIGDEDSGYKTWPSILQSLAAPGERRNPEFVAGYLSAVFARDHAMWETIALELLKDNVLKAYVDRLIGGSGMTDRILTELCVAVERGDISPDAVDRVGYTGPSFGISIRRCTDLIEWCVKQGTPRLVQIGLKTAHVLFCHGKDVPPIPAQPLLDLLTAPKALDPGKRGHFHYEWAEIVKRYVAIYPQHAMCLLESTLHRFSDFDFVLDMMHSAANDAIRVLISREPQSAWTMIASRLVPLDGLFARNLREWLGPRETIGEKTIQCMLSTFDPRDILAWIDIAQQERAPFIARKSPKTFDPGEGGELTRQLLIRYGNLDRVRNAMTYNFWSESWCGEASEHHRKKRERMREWITHEKESAIVDWLVEFTDGLGVQIKQDEIREEREY